MTTIIPPATTPPASVNLSTVLTQAPPPVPVTVSATDQALATLTRVIQTNATVTSEPTANSVTLATSLGALTVAFAQSLSSAEKQSLIQQLITLLQTQKPLTLVLQPGSPPTQATIILPSSSVAATTNAPPTPVPNYQATPLQVGEVFPAIVLATAPPSETAILSLQQTMLANNAPVSAQQAPPPAGTSPSPVNPLNTPPPLETIALPVGPTTLSLAPQQAAPLPTQPQNLALPIAPNPEGIVETLSPASTLAQTAPSILQENAALPLQTAATQTPPVSTPNVPIPPPNSPATNLSSPSAASIPLASLLQPGNEVTISIDAILPPATTANMPPLAANQIAATVSGLGTNGELILKSGDAVLFVKAPVTAPIGTTVIISVDPARPAPLFPLPALANANFPSLPQALASLVQLNPQILQQVINNYIPQPTQALPGALMFLLSAFKGGNAREWLGSAMTDSLSAAGKMELIASLSKSLANAGQITQDPVVGQWRSYPIPLYAQQQFQSLTLHVHSDRDARQNQSGNEDKGKIRFLIDVRLSKLGDMQIDGFVQPKKLDMILRSENILPEGLHNELRGAYIKALGAVGYNGTLNFQTGRQHWIAMSQPAARGIVT